MAVHRVIAPRHLAGGVVELSGGVPPLHIPPSGIVEIADTHDQPGDIGNFEPRPDRVNHTHLRELLALGFQHAPAAGGVADRPAGRFDGDQWFDTYASKPLWWSCGAWRDALGRVV
jgi:hypothetical protein